jgi:hypothetical protein
MRNASKWDPALLNSIDTIETHILRPILDFYRNDTTNPLNNTWVYNNLENFIQLLSLGYQFDDTAPFSSSVKILSDLQGVIPNDRINDVISLLNTFVKDFISIQKDNEGKELIAFNVESYLSHLSQIKPDKYRKGSFLFTVGTGNIWFDTPYRTDASSTISTLGFVSEKIGFKFKVIDKNWKSRSPGDSYKSIWGYYYTKLSPPKEPLISDVHLLFYGSGILYNIINTSTNKNFTSPIVSAGFGVTFFNNLDFNLSVGTVPNTSISTLNNTFYGIGFDVPFMEYLERVNENQKAKRTQKLLAEAND